MHKADLHLHAKEDLLDRGITYSYKAIIKKAKKLNFKVIAFTFHEKVFWKQEFSKEKDLLILPGIEANIQGNHVLVYTHPSNISILKKLEGKRNSFPKLLDLKEKHDLLVGAPHPCYPKLISSSLGKTLLLKYSKLFDFIEFSGVFLKNFNRYNKEAIKIAKKLDKPILRNSDSHLLEQFGRTYSLFFEEINNFDDLMQVIKRRKLKVKAKPLSTITLLKFMFRV